MSTWDRCITRGVPGSMLPTGYNNAYRILQAPGLVVILHEMIHEARIVPVTDRAHIDGDVELWTGDARAHWEGDTLVVDTTNFNDQAMIVTSSNGGRLKGLPVGDSMHVVERFTRVSRDEIMWEVTIEDPDVYDRPWTISMPLRQAPGYEMYEYACHEGNQDVANHRGGGLGDRGPRLPGEPGESDVRSHRRRRQGDLGAELRSARRAARLRHRRPRRAERRGALAAPPDSGTGRVRRRDLGRRPLSRSGGTSAPGWCRASIRS